jgi:hypothetical protein
MERRYLTRWALVRSSRSRWEDVVARVDRRAIDEIVEVVFDDSRSELSVQIFLRVGAPDVDNDPTYFFKIEIG